MENLVEIDRRKIINIGGSLYLLLPPLLRRNLSAGDEVSYSRSPGSSDIILRVEKHDEAAV